MAKFRKNKEQLKHALESMDWMEAIEEIQEQDAKELLGPLLGFLLHQGDLRWRAATAIGVSVAALATRNIEDARVILRRLMWHMNEESGNIGWGIPESMASILVRSKPLAKEFAPILLSYISDTGREDNFVDHPPLLRSCFFAVGRFSVCEPELALPALPYLLKGMRHEDAQVRGQAALALFKLIKAASDATVPALHEAATRSMLQDGVKILEGTPRSDAQCEIFNGQYSLQLSVDDINAQTLQVLKNWD